MKLIRELILDLNLPRPPFALIAAVFILVPASWLPLAFIVRTRVTLSENRPINIFQDMDVQPRFDAQAVNPIFADNRAMRQDPPGTVAWGTILDDDHYSLGFHTDGEGAPLVTTQADADGSEILTTRYFSGFPQRVPVDDALLQRGRQRYNIYCGPCHGRGGYGDGAVNQRALSLGELENPLATWVTASNLHTVDQDTKQLTYGPRMYPEGKMFNTITNGIRNMPGYGSQIEPHDRWAIIAYVQALQLSQRAADLPAREKVSSLE